MSIIGKIVFVITRIFLFNKNKNISYNDLNFKKLDFTNYKQIKQFIFKKEFYKLNNRHVQGFEFLNFSKNLGGAVGINLSKKSIFSWYNINKYKLKYPWSEDFTSKRFINMVYNYEFINSASNNNDRKTLDNIIYLHIERLIYDFNKKKLSEITCYDLVANYLSCFIIKKINDRNINYIDMVLDYQIDKFGMHKSYNVVEHAKYINSLNELKNIFLYFENKISKKFEETIIRMSSILNEYFHSDGSIPLFNGSNNNYTKIINSSLNKEEYLKSRNFENTNNGIAFYSDKNKKIFFDVVQPNKDKISSYLSAGTLSFEMSFLNEKIITNCGASETYGKNPEYLRYSAAHSTIILQNTNISEVKENNPHIKFPQSVTFNFSKNEKETIFEGSHNGYIKKFNKIVKRKIVINHKKALISGEDTIISLKKRDNRTIYHIRFHLNSGISFNFSNSKRNLILKSKNNSMWLFRSDMELLVEDSIIVDKNMTNPTKQIVIKGIALNTKQIRKWSLEKI
tara:strand:+ start:1202 stop:2734 length:1533 start_codon:yes stop_codon:yes gene_type:complete